MTALVVGGATTGQFILGVLTLVTGGGIVQLAIFLLRRRSELRALDATAQATERTSSTPLLEGWEGIVRQLKQNAKETEEAANEKIKHLEKRLDEESRNRREERKEFTRGLNSAHSENERLAGEVASLRTDNDVLTRQVDQLRRQLRVQPE